MRSLSFVLALAFGCAGGGYSTGVSYGAYGSPDLVYVSPGVYGVANVDAPIFYADRTYWRYDAGSWYRSPRYYGGWRRAAPPVSVRRIDRPGLYAHGRPSGRVHVDVREQRVRAPYRHVERGHYQPADRGHRGRVRVLDRD